MILEDNKFKKLRLKGEWNEPSHSKEKIPSLQAEIQNLKKRTTRRGYNRNESNTKNTKGKDSKENPTWMNKNIKPENSK